MGGGQVTAGYSGTALVKKLGLKEGMQALLIAVPTTLPDISRFPGFSGVETTLPASPGRVFDYSHIFETERGRLEALAPAVHALLKPDGMLWVSWPKKASKVKTDVTENVLREMLLPTGLVDVKVAAIDGTWSGLKFVFRRELRAGL